jgi:hypothetical protein
MVTMITARGLRSWLALVGLAVGGAVGATLAGCGGSSTSEPTVDAPATDAPAEEEAEGEENL